jgi:hypothetical protein
MFVPFVLVIAAIVFFSIGSEIVMRVRLTIREVPSERLLWWRKGGDEVASTYQEVFPGTRLPVLRNITFYTFIALCIVILAIFTLKRS